MSSLLVVGASRGIGLEFARQYAADGFKVTGTVRSAAGERALREVGAEPIALDVLDEAAVAALGAQFAARALERVVLNAGVYGPRVNALVPPTASEFDLVMRTNVRAPMQLIAALTPALTRAPSRLAVISSRMGSVSMMGSTSGWLYRASKAALNCVTRAASLDLGARGVVCIAFHPGWVRTDMGGAAADIDVETSVAGMRRVLENANASANGKFINYNGEQLAW
jgi:NAD(P)-dependent dehydrogenase (short-subunit alcohol dehydrogenase family)